MVTTSVTSNVSGLYGLKITWLQLRCRFQMYFYCYSVNMALRSTLFRGDFFHYCCHVLDDCKTEQDIKNKLVAWIHNVNMETKSVFSQVQVKIILLVCNT